MTTTAAYADRLNTQRTVSLRKNSQSMNATADTESIRVSRAAQRPRRTSSEGRRLQMALRLSGMSGSSETVMVKLHHKMAPVSIQRYSYKSRSLSYQPLGGEKSDERCEPPPAS